MGKKPYFPFYPGDWIRDPISGCSLAAQGLWLRMMIVAHDCSTYGELSVDGSPMPNQAIARRCGCSIEEFESLFRELTHSGVPGRKSDGTIYSRRMVRDEKVRKIREKVGKKGGNPGLRKARDDLDLQVLVNQNPTIGLTNHLTKPSEDEDENVSLKVVEKKKRKILSLEEYFQFAREEICQILERDREDFKRAFPAVDLDREAAQALTWLKNNPQNRKKEIGRFLNNWLSREQEKAGRSLPKGGEDGRDARTYRRPYTRGIQGLPPGAIEEADRINAEYREAKRLKREAQDHPAGDA
jgi:hypothetical protein